MKIRDLLVFFALFGFIQLVEMPVHAFDISVEKAAQAEQNFNRNESNKSITLSGNILTGSNQYKQYSASFDWFHPEEQEFDSLRLDFKFVENTGQIFQSSKTSVIYGLTVFQNAHVLGLFDLKTDNFSRHKRRVSYGIGVGKNFINNERTILKSIVSINNNSNLLSQTVTGSVSDAHHESIGLLGSLKQSLSDNVDVTISLKSATSLAKSQIWFLEGVVAMSMSMSSSTALSLAYQLDQRSHHINHLKRFTDTNTTFGVKYNF